MNTDLINRLPLQYRDNLVYCPDVLPFNYTETEYQNHWQTLLESPYLYSNGYEIRPCSFFQYSVQQIKGRLGLSNYCHPYTLDLTLKKLAYYGYLRNYSPACLNDRRHGFDRQFINLITAPRNSIRSALIQQELIAAFKRHQAILNPNTPSPNMAYGETLRQLKLWQEIPALDPQNLELIQETIEKLHEIEHALLPGSLYAQHAAQYAVAKAETLYLKGVSNHPLFNHSAQAHRALEMALTYYPEIALVKPSAYIRYYIEKNDPASAYWLIEHMENIQLGVTLLLKHFSEELQKQWVKPDSRLGVVLAAYYLQQNSTLENIQLAMHFDSQLDAHAPAKLLPLPMYQQDYERAYLIVCNNPNLTFSLKVRRILSDHFTKQAINAEKEHHYEDSLNARKKAWQMMPNEENAAAYKSQKKRFDQWVIDREPVTQSGFHLV